jgi:hypothetical protein
MTMTTTTYNVERAASSTIGLDRGTHNNFIKELNDALSLSKRKVI